MSYCYPQNRSNFFFYLSIFILLSRVKFSLFILLLRIFHQFPYNIRIFFSSSPWFPISDFFMTWWSLILRNTTYVEVLVFFFMVFFSNSILSLACTIFYSIFIFRLISRNILNISTANSDSSCNCLTCADLNSILGWIYVLNQVEFSFHLITNVRWLWHNSANLITKTILQWVC